MIEGLATNAAQAGATSLALRGDLVTSGRMAELVVADDGRGTFFCSGFELQRVLCVPSSDLVVVRLGKTPESDYDTPKRWLEEIVSAFDA